MQNITLIGKGLVAKHLLEQFGKKIVRQYDSGNISSFPDHIHEIVFCAAPSAKKWLAHQQPKVDEQNCLSLAKILTSSRIEKVIHFSTVDVYENVSEVKDESEESYTSHPYGKHRRRLEVELSKNFDTSIVRLPGLFGKFLEKNYIFDLMNDNNLDKIVANSQFQWLDLKNMRKITEIAMNTKSINMTTEPLNTMEVIDRFFPQKKSMVNVKDEGASYNVRSGHFDSGYFLKKEQVISDMEEFINAWNNDGRNFR